MRLYRVFPHDPSAVPSAPGGALYVPPSSGLGRIDNPEEYDAFYLAGIEEAAVAESFGNLAVWRDESFVEAGRNVRYALAAYDLSKEARLFDFNDVEALQSLGVRRPTQVITRDRRSTQELALRIYRRRRFAGVTWWSYYNPDWPICGLWNVAQLRLLGEPMALSATAPAVQRAAAAIVRQIVL